MIFFHVWPNIEYFIVHIGLADVESHRRNITFENVEMEEIEDSFTDDQNYSNYSNDDGNNSCSGEVGNIKK